LTLPIRKQPPCRHVRGIRPNRESKQHCDKNNCGPHVRSRSSTIVRRCPTPKLTNADLSDLAAAFTFALRYQGRKRVRNADELMAAELAKAERPVSTRELVQIICQTEGKNGQDRRVFADVTKRASKALREMRRLGIVASEQDRRGTFVWATLP
jgi:hypothetical protein